MCEWQGIMQRDRGSEVPTNARMRNGTLMAAFQHALAGSGNRSAVGISCGAHDSAGRGMSASTTRSVAYSQPPHLTCVRYGDLTMLVGRMCPYWSAHENSSITITCVVCSIHPHAHTNSTCQPGQQGTAKLPRASMPGTASAQLQAAAGTGVAGQACTSRRWARLDARTMPRHTQRSQSSTWTAEQRPLHNPPPPVRLSLPGRGLGCR